MIPAWRGPRRPKSSRRSPGMEPRRRPPTGEDRDGRTGFPRAGPRPATRGRVSCSGNPVAFASQAWTGGGRPARSARTRSSTRMPRASGSPNRPGRPSITSLFALISGRVQLPDAWKTKPPHLPADPNYRESGRAQKADNVIRARQQQHDTYGRTCFFCNSPRGLATPYVCTSIDKYVLM